MCSIKKFIKYFRVTFSLLLCVLLCGCQRGMIGSTPSEHTEFVVDGEYRPFNVPRKTMEKLMELVVAEDVDSICEAFSNSVKENANNLESEIQDLVHFLRENVVSWDFTGAYSTGNRYYGIYTEMRSATYSVQTNGGVYTCCILDVPNNSEDQNVVGFSSISIYPVGLDIEYGHNGQYGSLVVYRVGQDTEDFLVAPSPMEKLVELIDQGDTDGILKVFSPVVRDTANGLQEKASELISFMDNQVISWEPYTWMQNEQYINGVRANLREMFFYLHTDHGLYRCDIRDIPEDTSQGVSAGIYSISIFPALFQDQTPGLDDTYDGYCTWSRENMGISIAYQQENQTS